MRPRLAMAAVVALLAAGVSAAPGGISGTKHDLSVTGRGPLKSRTEPEKCKFCHTPHVGNRKRPLWNRRDTGTVFIRYRSATLDVAGGLAPEPDSASLMCLTCHDGTVAVGAVRHAGAARSLDDVPAIPAGSRANFGADLSGTHPISFVYDDNLVARNNARDMPLRSTAEVRAARVLDREDKVQCTSCHDAHDDANRATSGVPFYRAPDFADGCARCHRF